MKADTFIKLLRKVIREEVQSVVREELGLLLETPEPRKTVTETKKPVAKNSMVESIRPVAKQSAKPTSFTNNNILNDILNETAHAGEWKSVANMNSNMAQGFNPSMGFDNEPQPIVVESVDQMLANTRPAGDINAVRIDAVPDFSALMSTMKEKGQI
jgi:hypothetical protein